jgi:hypothetical protein
LLLEGRDDVLDEELERALLLLMGQAVVGPDAELIYAKCLLVAEALDHLIRRPDHRGLVEGLRREFRAVGEFLGRARLEEAVLRSGLVSEPGIKLPVELLDALGRTPPSLGFVSGVDVGGLILRVVITAWLQFT